MPDFTRAEISTGADDLSEYTTFLRKLSPGQFVTLPLQEGESSRVVMRSLNAAAVQSDMRLARLASDEDSVRFRVKGNRRTARPNTAVATAMQVPEQAPPSVPGGVTPQLPGDAPATVAERDPATQRRRRGRPGSAQRPSGSARRRTAANG